MKNDRVIMRFVLSVIMLSLTIPSLFADERAPEGDRTSLSQCEELLNSKGFLTPGKNYSVRNIPEGCIISNSIYNTSTFVSWTIEKVTLEVDHLQDYVSDTPDWSKTLPKWGHIAIEGMRMTLQSGRRLSDYITSIQQWPMDISVSYRFNPKTGYLHLQKAELSSTKMGKASISAEINLPEGSSIASFTDNPTVTVSHLRMRLDNQGMWESLALPVFANYAALPTETGEDDPETDMNKLRDLATTGIEKLPENQIDASSRKALLNFIQDMPHPTGFFSIDLQYDTPLPINLDFFEHGKLPEAALTDGKITAIYRAR
ncbi:hypothetical protein ACLBWZ_13685 [Brucellaceae bacterium C25G]